MTSSMASTPDETARLDLEFRQYLHILRPYLTNLLESDAMPQCGAWMERLTRCAAHERRARNRAVFALCYQLSRGVLAPPFLSAPPDSHVDLTVFLAECCMEGEVEVGGVAAEGVEGAGEEGSEGTATARTCGDDAQLPQSSAELWVNPATEPTVTTSRTECDSRLQTSADTCARRHGGGVGVETSASGRDISEALSATSLSAAWVSNSRQNIACDGGLDARTASLLMKLRDIKQQNTLLGDELHALKQETHRHSHPDLDTRVHHKADEEGLLRRRLAQATHSRRLLQDAVSALECRLGEVRDIAAIELRDAEVKYKMESERMRAELTRQLERAAHEHAINIREVEERCAREGAEAVRERDAIVREKEQEIKRLQAVVEEYADKLEKGARAEEERRASLQTREQALEGRVARAERARARYVRVCGVRVARAHRETKLTECRSQLKLAEQRARLRDAAARDTEAEVTRAVGALETKYKDIVASVQAAAIKRRVQDQLSLQCLLQSCGLRGTPAQPAEHRQHAYRTHYHTADKHAEDGGRWGCGGCAGAERDLTPAPLAAAPQARDQTSAAEAKAELSGAAGAEAELGAGALLVADAGAAGATASYNRKPSAQFLPVDTA